MYIIYRKRDNLIAGHVYPRRTDAAQTLALSTEIQNIVNSELGGSESDYSYIKSDSSNFVKDGFDTVLDADLNVIFIKSEAQEALDTARLSAINKLKALGLTDEEIGAIK